jgi:cytoskeleton protein RodZ
MSETEEIQSEPGLTKGPEEPVESSPGLGATLRAEREKRGLSLDQVASATKLRSQLIDALENEAWGKLPHPVFVRGFIRTYAKVVGADEKDLLGMYERLMPARREPIAPLAAPRRSLKGWYLAAILTVVLLGIVFLLWQEHASPPRETTLVQTEAPPEGTLKKEDNAKEAQPEKVETPEKAEIRERATSTQGNAPPTTPLPSADQKKGEVSLKEAVSKNDQEKPKAEVSEVQNLAVPAPEQREDAYTLKAIVVERTWIRISIDDGEPKEYLFDPGFSIQWEAQKGFALLVGNAGGIELELNGQNLGKPGKLGQVIRLQLPKGYTPTRSAD